MNVKRMNILFILTWAYISDLNMYCVASTMEFLPILQNVNELEM